MSERIAMAGHQLLTPQEHGQLRVLPRTGVEPHFVEIVPAELAAAAIACPILFTKNASTGAFYAGAVLGLKPGEGALKSPEERGGFEPLNLQRDGFFISGERIAIDRANARFSETDGESLFDPGQQPTPSLRRIQKVLGQLHEGGKQTAALVRDLLELRLLEPIDISLSFDDGERLRLEGLYTVSRDSLRELEDVHVLTLFRSGHLQLAYTIAGSLNQLAVLAHARNRRLAAA